MNVCACVFAMHFLQRGWLQLLGKVRSPSLAVPRYPDQQPASAAMTGAADMSTYSSKPHGRLEWLCLKMREETNFGFSVLGSM